MNKQRRTAIAKLQRAIWDLTDQLESVMYEEQDAFDAMPESLQLSARGEAMEEAIAQLEEAIQYLGDASICLDDAVGQ